MTALFASFERRPESCQALYVGNDNIDSLARYYAENGYDTDVARSTTGPARLTMQRGGDIVIVDVGQALVYGHPPTVVVDPEDFSRDWRPARAERP